jgi:hypothetical protein
MTDLLGVIVAFALVALLWGAAFWATARMREWSGPGPRVRRRE